MFSALSEIAGKPRAKEKFPTFKIPMLQKLSKERLEVDSHKSSSSDYDSANEDFDD